MRCKICALQALECNAQGRKVARGKKKGRRTALYFRLIRPASGLHAHDMQAQGDLPCLGAMQSSAVSTAHGTGATALAQRA